MNLYLKIQLINAKIHILFKKSDYGLKRTHKNFHLVAIVPGPLLPKIGPSSYIKSAADIFSRAILAQEYVAKMAEDFITRHISLKKAVCHISGALFGEKGSKKTASNSSCESDFTVSRASPRRSFTETF